MFLCGGLREENEKREGNQFKMEPKSVEGMVLNWILIPLKIYNGHGHEMPNSHHQLLTMETVSSVTSFKTSITEIYPKRLAMDRAEVPF